MRFGKLELSLVGVTAVFMIVASIFLGGCAYPADLGDDAPKAVRNIRYVQDDRTGICFAVLGSVTYYGYQAISIATVPCELAALEGGATRGK